MGNEEILCRCKQVSYKTVEDAIKNGANTVEAIQEKTKAGTGCRSCISKINEAIKKYQ